MKLGIVIATYQKSDGTTPFFLTRALQSIKQQTYQDYIIIVIGDKYEDNIEFENICKSININHKLVYKNLPYAKEREKYSIGTKELWSSGGVNARNHGIDIALNLGLEYICHLDHDDYWNPNHLEIINDAIIKTQSPVVHTCSTYFNTYLPNIKLTNEIIETKINAGEFIHSSICINHKTIPLKYRDVFEITGTEYAADADLWKRINEYTTINNIKTYLISTLTCFHPTEGNTLTNN